VPALPAGLSRLDAAGLRAESELCDVELLDLDLRDEQLTALSLETARVKGCRFEGAELRRLHCRQVVFETCDFANTRWFDCELSDVAFLDCRFVGVSITGGGLSAVLMRDCLAQLAKLSHLGRPHALLEGCDLRGALLMESDLSELRFAGCDLEGLELAGVTLAGSDLRTNELAGLKGVACLRGATVDALQLLALAPALAAHVGLVVEQAGLDA
jgi:uncharacterized protein YjbI with pentapeptide repeats